MPMKKSALVTAATATLSQRSVAIDRAQVQLKWLISLR